MLKPATLRLSRFVVVGISAFAVHWLCVAGLVETFGMQPLLANIIAFLCALPVSYLGHKNWTFAARDQAHSDSIPRFLLSAASGFLINEACYAVLLWLNPAHFRLDLFGAIVLSAVSIYLLSHYWVFPGSQKDS